MVRAPAIVVAVALAAGCSFEAGFDGSRYRCGDDHGACPADYQCIDGFCQLPGVSDAASDAAAPDGGPDASIGADAAPVNVCVEADAAPRADDCGDGAARDLTAEAREPGGVTVYGDTSDYGNHLASPASGCLGYVTAGADAIYSIQPEVGEQVSARLITKGWDSAVFLTSLCDTGGTCYAGEDETFQAGTQSQPAEEIIHTVSVAERLYLLVDSALLPTQPNSKGCFSLEVRLE